MPDIPPITDITSTANTTSIHNILPVNASHLQRDLDRSIGPSVLTESMIEQIPGIKYNPPDELLPWLVWEYGLTPLLPYLSNPRQAIQEGVRWQRIRGTPESLSLSLGWLGLHTIDIEPEVPGRHFYQYQVDTGRIVTDNELENVKAVAQFSAPLRSRLSRLYHEYDVRRLLLDDSDYGALLSDYSGVRTNGLVLSFGRTHQPELPTLEIEGYAKRLTRHSTLVQDVHWPTLDQDPLGGIVTVSHRPNSWRSAYSWVDVQLGSMRYRHRDHDVVETAAQVESKHQVSFRLTLTDDYRLGEHLSPAMRIAERPRSLRGLMQQWQGYWDHRTWSQTGSVHIGLRHQSVVINNSITVSWPESVIFHGLQRENTDVVQEALGKQPSFELGQTNQWMCSETTPLPTAPALSMPIIERPRSLWGTAQLWQGYWDDRIWAHTSAGQISVRHSDFHINDSRSEMDAFEPSILRSLLKQFSVQLPEASINNDALTVSREYYRPKHQILALPATTMAPMRITERPRSLMAIAQRWGGDWDTRIWHHTTSGFLDINRATFFYNNNAVALDGVEPEITHRVSIQRSRSVVDQAQQIISLRAPHRVIVPSLSDDPSAQSLRFSWHALSSGENPDDWAGHWDTRNWRGARPVLIGVSYS